ncbi:MAG: efflux RND transporter permease subunit [Spirochaetales bacterium]|nr:efflux RND transporter permease subunit [Spirochaetales bacterium]
MKISETAVKVPITTIMIFIALGLLGFISLMRLGQELFPDITYPTAVVFTVYPGVGPLEVEASVTKPIEDAVTTLGGVEKVSSTSSEGYSMVVVNFTWGTKMEQIVPDLREKIAAIEDTLPEGSEKPGIFKYNPSQLPTLTFNVSVKEDMDVRNLVEKKIKPELEKIPGVATASLFGGRTAAVMCKIRLDSISKMEIPVVQILQVFKNENINLPGGSISLENRQIILRTVGEFQSLDDIGNVLVGYRQRVPVFLKDVADISLDYLPQEEYVRAGEYKGVQVQIRKQTGYNTVLVNDAVKERLEQLKPLLPPSVRINITTDQSISIRNSIGGVADAAVKGGLLAILVLIVFLRNIRSTLIISLSIPLSIIATFTLLDFSGLSLNMLSLMGLSLGVGMFVDNSVVVLESIYRKHLSGMKSSEAAVAGVNEVAMAIAASTLTSVVVFLPIVFVEGLAGLMFRDLSFTISYSLLMSLAMALTLVPVLSSKFLKVNKNTIVIAGNRHKGDELSLADIEVRTGNRVIDFFSRNIQKILVKLDDAYEKILTWAMRHSVIVVATAVLLLVLSVSAIFLMGLEFIPEADEGKFTIYLETRIGTSYANTERKVLEIEKIINETIGADLEATFASVGQSGGSISLGATGSHLATIKVNLIPKDDREKTIWQIVNEVSHVLKKRIVDAKIGLAIEGVSSLVSSATGASASLVIEVSGNDLEQMFAYSKRIAAVMERVPGTRDVKVTFETGKPELQFRIKRREAVSLGLSPLEIAATIRAAYKGVEVSRYKQGDNDYDVMVLLEDRDRNDINRISRLFLINRAGVKIPIENVVDIVEAEGPLTIQRSRRTRQMMVTGSLTGETPLNVVSDEIQKGVDALGLPPEGVKVEMTGNRENMTSSFRDLGWALLLSLVLVYMIMASQFESLLHPFIIMFTIPFAIIGLVGALLITNTTFSILAFLGGILLVGIVVNNGIVLIDYMNQLQKRGVPLMKAIIRGGKTRLKPVLMTTFTTLVGLIPMSLNFGMGAELRFPIGRAVLGGLTTSTIVTLILIPVIYFLIESRLRKRPVRSRRRKA